MIWLYPDRSLQAHRLGVAILAALGLSLCAGCSGRALQADNPVLGATPPRRNLQVAAQTAEAEAGSTSATGVEQASFSDGSDPVVDPEMSGIAATVNGRPILISDVLERFTPQLKAAEAQLPPAEFADLRQRLIERELPAHIEQALLVDTALSQLTADQRKMVEEQLDKMFPQYLAMIQQEMGARSLAELEAVLQQHGSSITNFRRSFNNRQLADQAMGLLAPAEPTVTRSELLGEYQQRLEEFTEPEKVRWQQIWIAYNRHGGQQGARARMDAALRALQAGTPFEAVAREYSDVNAEKGGQWDWTLRGELSSEEVDRLLFELAVGETSRVIEDGSALQVVRVSERVPETTRTFAEVQNQLVTDLRERKEQEMLKDIKAELKKKAIIVTMFDGEKTETP